MAVILITVISCSDAVNIINRLVNIANLTNIQKTEIIQEIRKTIPFCPVVIKKDTK
jgi:hypothetical protein